MRQRRATVQRTTTVSIDLSDPEVKEGIKSAVAEATDGLIRKRDELLAELKDARAVTATGMVSEMSWISAGSPPGICELSSRYRARVSNAVVTW